MKLPQDVERLGSWPADDEPGQFVIWCSCQMWSFTGTVAEVNAAAVRHDDSPWRNHVVAIYGRLRSAGEPGHRERDGDQGNANEPVQHGIDPS